MHERTPPRSREPQFRLAQISTTNEARTIRFVASDETVDRYGDIIRASGWQLTNYTKNGPLLFAHDSRSPPIGTAKAWVEGTRLLADATFLEEGVSEFADEIWRITDAGALKAVSVGFLPFEWNLIRGEPDDSGYAPVTGYEFTSQELLELSVVPVPANPQALALARSLAREETARALFVDEDRASARIAAAARARSITLARLRVGHFSKGASHDAA
jgi:Escherichia/Staphylococcus phage prohead protease